VFANLLLSPDEALFLHVNYLFNKVFVIIVESGSLERPCARFLLYVCYPLCISFSCMVSLVISWCCVLEECLCRTVPAKC
jgi:hypothetical protein